MYLHLQTSKKIIEPLLPRFVVLGIPPYMCEEFRIIARIILKQKLLMRSAMIIAQGIWNELGSRDILRYGESGPFVRK